MKHIVVFNPIVMDQVSVSIPNSVSISIHSFQDVQKKVCQTFPIFEFKTIQSEENKLEFYRYNQDDIVTLVFTSGSTGMPKVKCSS